MNNKKTSLIHSLVGGWAIPCALNLIVNLFLVFILPFVGALAYLMFPLTYLLPIIYIGVGVKYSSIYLRKNNAINAPATIVKLSTIYYTIFLIFVSIVTYFTQSTEILGLGIILVPSFYLFTKKYFTKK